jgi:Mrp family chromosome partitioning ATPase
LRRTNSRRGGRQDGAGHIVSRIGTTSGLRVLLIDADVRHPSATSFLGVKKAVGLVDLLLENADLQEVIKFRGCEDVALFATSVGILNDNQI